MKYKKAPGAPKRFKSAYMYFSEQEHKRIRDGSANKKIRAAEVAKLVSQAWKDLPDAQRSVFVEMGRRDRERYEQEKANYKGPWKVPDIKDPNAPKKPMSAFLAFGNERRGIIAEANPSLTGTEISSLLSKLWKECPADVKQSYRDREAREREEFKKKLAAWEHKRDAEYIADHQSSGDDVSQPSLYVGHPTPGPCRSLRINEKSACTFLEALPDIGMSRNKHMVSADSLDDKDDDDATLDELMEVDRWPLESDIPHSIVLPIIQSTTMNAPVAVPASSKFDNYSMDDVLEDEDLFFEDFSPSAVVSNNADNNNNNDMAIPFSNSLMLPPVTRVAKLGRFSGGADFLFC
eukprot:scaffold1591_cov176-Amphora_coffeaeformis.AAC.3